MEIVRLSLRYMLRLKPPPLPSVLTLPGKKTKQKILEISSSLLTPHVNTIFLAVLISLDQNEQIFFSIPWLYIIMKKPMTPTIAD